MNHIPTHMLVNELLKRTDDFCEFGVDDFISTAAEYDESLLADVTSGLSQLREAYIETVVTRVVDSIHPNQGDEDV